jgi:hypothetical protein
MDAITPKEIKQDTRFLPAVAEAVGQWFPELGGRALAVSEVTITKENIPTLPLAMVAFVRSVGNQPDNSTSEMFDIVDSFVIEFWLEPARYKKANGSETPFWSFYDYDAVRDTLLSNLVRWETPNGERIAYRGLTTEAEQLAVTLTFSFVATFRWCPSKPAYLGEPFTVGFNLCAPPACIPDPCEDVEIDQCHPCP